MVRSREQDREYQREYRKRKAAESHGPGERASSGGVVRDLVQRELDSLPASKVMLASTAAALAMADVLDDPSAVPQHPAAAGQLRQVVAELRAARAPVAQSALSMIRGGRAG